MNGRIAWVDRWKGLLIFLVVLGHVVGGGWHFSHGTVQRMLVTLYQGIYMFHMPAFAFLAGMMWRTTEIGFGRYVWRKFQRLMVPYYIFGIASIALYAIFSGSVVETMQMTGTEHYSHIGNTSWWTMPLALLHGGGWPGDGFRANSVLWFLPCLFMTEIIYYWIDRVFQSKIRQLCLIPVLIGLCYTLRFYHGVPLPMMLSRVPGFLSFVIIGRFANPREIESALGHYRWAFLSLVLPSLCLYVWIVYRFGGVWAWHSGILWLVFFEIVAVIGIAASIIIVLLFKVWILAFLGLFTMGVMLMHKPLLMALQLKVKLILSVYAGGSVWMALIVSIGVAIVVSSACAGVSYAIRKIAPWLLGEGGV